MMQRVSRVRLRQLTLLRTGIASIWINVRCTLYALHRQSYDQATILHVPCMCLCGTATARAREVMAHKCRVSEVARRLYSTFVIV